MISSDAIAEGGCQCGRHRFSITAAPFAVSYCHCNESRRATGAPVAVLAGVHDDAVDFTEPPATFASSAHAQRWFCPDCGTPLAYRDRRLPGELYLLVGAFDEPERLTPQRHAFTSRQLPWLHIADELPRHREFRRARAGADPGD